MKSVLTQKSEIAYGTMAFHFTKPQGFDFRPGQYVDITLINPPETDAEGNTRSFSIAAAPYEDEILIATRMRDTAFKRVLKDAPVAFEVEVSPPQGSFFLHKDTSKPAVMLAGGIGITPFRSMIAQALHANQPYAITLFCSSKTEADLPWYDDLKTWGEAHTNFTPVFTITKPDMVDSVWSGETGYIDQAMLETYLDDLTLPIYYIAGPGGFVTAMRQMLVDAGIDEDTIRSEDFPGY